MARASGSYPLCPEFKSLSRHQTTKKRVLERELFFHVSKNLEIRDETKRLEDWRISDGAVK